jgi:hypothetical protein
MCVIKLFVFYFILKCVFSDLSTNEVSIDWTAFETQEHVSDEDSVRLIKSFPVHQYWDVIKGSFRTGVIGDTISSSHPSFVSLVEKRVQVNGKTISTQNYAVETSSLFMYSLSALRHIIKVSDRIKSDVLLKDRVATSSGITMGNVQLSAIDDLKAQLKCLQYKKSHMQTSLLRHEHNSMRRKSKLMYYGSLKRNDFEATHEVLLNEMQLHHQLINSTSVSTYGSLVNMSIDSKTETLNRNKLYLRKTHEIESKQLLTSFAFKLEAITFRAGQELQLLQDELNFEGTETATAKLASLRSAVEEVVDAVFDEAYAVCSAFTSDPWKVMELLRYLLYALCVSLLVFEVSQLCLSVLNRISKRSFVPRIIPSHGTGGLWKTMFNLHSGPPSTGVGDSQETVELMWGLQQEDCGFGAKLQVDRVMQAFAVAAQHGLRLPNILLSGPSGCGKSALSNILVSSLLPCMSHVVISGGDLLALGLNGGASLFLTNLIRDHSSKFSWFRDGSEIDFEGSQKFISERLIIVIDEADCIVASRDWSMYSGSINVGSSATGGSGGCLFALLTGLKENSPHVSIILTTRLPVNCVDKALLDRYAVFLFFFKILFHN